MRTSSQILVFIDVQQALEAGIKFYISDNGVILTEGDERGYLVPKFFQRVEDAKHVPLYGWEGSSAPTGYTQQDVKTAGSTILSTPA